MTDAEIAPDPRDYPGMPAAMAKAGSLVFQPPKEAVSLDAPLAWWGFHFRRPVAKAIRQGQLGR